jgi:hypothetical protein
VPADISIVPAKVTEPVEEARFSQAELDQMLAPIALYPDVLLSQVLIASTYPLEVVSASRWSREHPDLEGEEAVAAAEPEDWDPSVKALVAFPELIQLMDENLDWTRRLGDAFLLQEEELMASIQALRETAVAEGNLEDLDHIVVEEEEDAIIIEPANVEVVYVPVYNTRYVYGSWWWHDYPPYCWGTWPSYHTSIGFRWSHGFHVSTSFYYSDCYWPRNRVVIIKPDRYKHHHDYKNHKKRRSTYHEAPAWRHNPEHRRGVGYRNEELNAVHERRSASGITRAPLPERSRNRPVALDRTKSRQPIPSGRSDARIARENTSQASTRPLISRKSTSTTTRTGPVVKSSPSQSRKVDARRPVEPNRSARIAKTERTQRITRTSPSGSSRSSSTTVKRSSTGNRKPTAGKSDRVAANSRNDRNTQPNKGRSQSQQPKREARSSRQSPPPSSSSKSAESSSSSSTWSNNSYASHRQSRSSQSSSSRPQSRPRPRDP